MAQSAHVHDMYNMLTYYLFLEFLLQAFSPHPLPPLLLSLLVHCRVHMYVYMQRCCRLWCALIAVRRLINVNYVRSGARAQSRARARAVHA